MDFEESRARSMDELFDQMKVAVKYVIENENILREIYRSKYIAVTDKGILGCDIDGLKLKRRVDEVYPNKTVLYGTIDEIVNPIVVEFPLIETDN